MRPLPCCRWDYFELATTSPTKHTTTTPTAHECSVVSSTHRANCLRQALISPQLPQATAPAFHPLPTGRASMLAPELGIPFLRPTHQSYLEKPPTGTQRYVEAAVVFVCSSLHLVIAPCNITHRTTALHRVFSPTFGRPHMRHLSKYLCRTSELSWGLCSPTQALIHGLHLQVPPGTPGTILGPLRSSHPESRVPTPTPEHLYTATGIPLLLC